MQLLRITIRYGVVAASLVALLTHLSLQVLLQDSYSDYLANTLYENPDRRSPLYTFVKISLFLAGLIVGCLLVTSKAVTNAINNLTITHKINCSLIIVLFSLFSLSRVYLVVDIFPFLHKSKGFVFREDGLMESLTAIFCFIAAYLILASMNRERGALVVFIKTCLSATCFFVGMEEISWGQRIFGWETPEYMIERNYQDETNLHNYFNPVLDIIVLVFNVGMCIFLAGINKVRRFLASKPGFDRLVSVMPSSQFQIYSLVFLFLSLQAYLFGAELTEIVISMITVIFAYEQYSAEKRCKSSPQSPSAH